MPTKAQLDAGPLLLHGLTFAKTASAAVVIPSALSAIEGNQTGWGCAALGTEAKSRACCNGKEQVHKLINEQGCNKSFIIYDRFVCDRRCS